MEAALAHSRKPAALAVPRLSELISAIGYLLAALAVLTALAVYFLSKHGTPVVDDAYIAFVYARNLASGHGLTYVGSVRVEGYTDFLWVLIAAGAIKLGIPPQTMAQLVSAASAAALIVLVWQYSRRETDAAPALRVAAPFLAALGPIAFWAIGGLETTTFTLLLLCAVVAATRQESWKYGALSGLFFFLAALAHPDAIVWFVPTLVFVALTRRPNRIARGAILAVSFGLPFLAYWIWRWNYFGDFFPNTLYAKSAPSLTTIEHGMRYVAGLSPVIGSLALALIVGAIPLGLLSRPRNRLFLVVGACWVGYVVWLGGDILLMRRFLVPVLPLAAILLQDALGLTLSELSKGRGAAPASTVLIGAAFVMATLAATVLDPGVAQVRIDGGADASRIEMGKWFADNTPSDELIAVNAAGAIPYYAQRATIDMLGLNDPHIAHDGNTDPHAPAGHQRFDAEYVLESRPAFIVFNSVFEEDQRIGPAFRSLPSIDALLAMPEFHQEYTRVRLTGPAKQELTYIRNDRLAAFQRSGLVSEVSP